MTTKTTKTKVERLKALIQNFEDKQKEYANYGAWDTEPDGVFQWLIKRTINGDLTPRDMPTTRADWQLYEIPGSYRATKALTGAARRVVNFLRKNDSVAVVRYCEDYCWRC